MIKVEPLLADAVRHFWTTRASQEEKQGTRTGTKDAGSRAAVTGGKHADGFINLLAAIVKDAGLLDVEIHTTEKASLTLPGFFRPTKVWDLVIICRGDLVGAVEVKSQVGSFGNNFNNRVEEAVGNATDFWTAYREGAFRPSQRPWLGYLFMLEEDPVSLRPRRRVALPHFAVDEAFQEQSYLKCYEEVCLRLLRERLYDACCYFSSSAQTGRNGEYREPNSELGIRKFAAALHGKASAIAHLT
ncbi:MAG: PaeR7I family type II restriction endonuclease [Acidobacteriota bacterium]